MGAVTAVTSQTKRAARKPPSEKYGQNGAAAISVAARFYHDRHFVRLNLLVTLIEPVRLPSWLSLMHSCKQLFPLEPTRPMGRLYDVSSGILGLAAVVPQMWNMQWL